MTEAKKSGSISEEVGSDNESRRGLSIRIWRIGGLISIAAVILWLAYLLVSPARIPSGDVICFKDPGINLARGEGLVSRLDPGNPTLEPKAYSNYPPLAPILYAGFVRCFGISPKVDELFDFLITAFASLLVWFLCFPRRGGLVAASAAVVMLGALLSTLPVGPFWTQRERPDTLAFCLILLSIASLRILNIRTAFFMAGIIAGVNWCLSPYGFLLNCLILTVLGIIRLSDYLRAGHLRKAFIDVAIALLGLLVPVSLLLLIGFVYEPDALNRFVSNALGRSTSGGAGLGYFIALLHGDIAHFFSAFSRYDSIRYKAMAGHLVAVFFLLCLFTTWHWRHLPTVGNRLIALAIAATAALPIVAFPYQPCYMSFTAMVITVAFVEFALFLNWQVTRVQWLAVVAVGLIAVPAGAFLARELVLTWKAWPSHERIDRVIASLEPSIDTPRPVVASAPSSYFSFKRRRFDVVNLASVERPEQVAKIDYFALTTLFDQPVPYQINFEGWNDLKTDRVYAGVLDYQSPLLNSRFSYTWECSIYRRRNKF